MGLIRMPYRPLTSAVLECNVISRGLTLLPLVLAVKATLVLFESLVAEYTSAYHEDQTGGGDPNDANYKCYFAHVLVSICCVRNEMPLWLVLEC